MVRLVRSEAVADAASYAKIGRLRDDASPTGAPEICWPDARLIRECLDGNERAWSALIDKYKNLIYSVPIRWGLPQADASDIFQSVIADLLTELGDLRDTNALPTWLVRVAAHKCMRRKREQMREVGHGREEPGPEFSTATERTLEDLLDDARREQILREALYGASLQCRDLIRMLFFEAPTRPYAEVAASLGVAVGSIGFVRRKCLERLRKFLEGSGFTAA